MMHIESLKTDSRISCEFISNQSKESNLYYDALCLGKFPSWNEMLMSSTQTNSSVFIRTMELFLVFSVASVK